MLGRPLKHSLERGSGKLSFRPLVTSASCRAHHLPQEHKEALEQGPHSERLQFNLSGVSTKPPEITSALKMAEHDSLDVSVKKRHSFSDCSSRSERNINNGSHPEEMKTKRVHTVFTRKCDPS